MTGATVPHGLPGAIRWAAFAVTRALAATFGEAQVALRLREHSPVTACPFDREWPQLALASTA